MLSKFKPEGQWHWLITTTHFSISWNLIFKQLTVRTVMQGSLLPGDYSHWVPVDDGDIWISRLWRVCLKLRRQVESCQDFTFETPAVLQHPYFIHHRHGHAQVTTWRNQYPGSIRLMLYNILLISYRVSLVRFVLNTCWVLFTDEAHEFHEAHRDALLIQLFSNSDTSPFTLWIHPLLIHHLTQLKLMHTKESNQTNTYV